MVNGATVVRGVDPLLRLRSGSTSTPASCLRKSDDRASDRRCIGTPPRWLCPGQDSHHRRPTGELPGARSVGMRVAYFSTGSLSTSVS